MHFAFVNLEYADICIPRERLFLFFGGEKTTSALSALPLFIDKKVLNWKKNAQFEIDEKSTIIKAGCSADL